MNILDMMNKLAALSKPVNEASTGNAFDLKTKIEPGDTKSSEKKSFVHKGTYGTEYDDNDKDRNKNKKKPAAAPAEKRGRGRPAKGADETGEVKKYDFTAFGAPEKGKSVKLPKWDKKKTTKHTMKEWAANLDAALKEADQVTIAPAQQNTQVIKQGNKTLGTVTNPGLANQIKQSIGKGEMSLAGKEIDEEKNYMGETQYNTYFGWKVASRKAGAKSFTGDRDIDQGLDASGKAVSEWDGVSGSVFDDAHKKGNKEVDEGRGDWDPNASDYQGDYGGAKNWGRRNREDDESHHLDNFYFTLVIDGVDQGKRFSSKSEANTAGLALLKANPGANIQIRTTTGGMNESRRVNEGKVKELDMDLKDKNMTDAEFKKKYKKSKAEMKAAVKGDSAKTKTKEVSEAQRHTKETGKKYSDQSEQFKGGKNYDELAAKKMASDMTKKSKDKLKEGVVMESLDPLQHIINTYKHEVKNFVAGGDLDQDLYEALFDYYANTGEMPYGTMKARTGDPFEWVSARFDRDVNEYDVPMDESVRPENVPAVMRKNRGDAPLSLNQVRAPRQDSMSDLSNLKTATSRLNPFNAKPVGDLQFESWDKKLNELVNEGMNITSNTGLEGPDSVTISATDQDADELLAVIRSAGLGVFGGEGASGPTDSEGMTDSGDAEIDVVDDHDGMLSLIKKMTGQGDEPQSQEEPEEEYSEEPEEEVDESNQEPAQPEETEDDEEVDESVANSADGDYQADIDFMTKGLSGGPNNMKKSQSIGNPMTVADKPLRESTDLLTAWRTLAGI